MTKRRVPSLRTPSARVRARRYRCRSTGTELSSLKSGAAFSINDALKRRADPWKDIAKAAGQRLPLGTKGRSEAP